MAELARRRGVARGHPIIDTVNDSLRAKFENLVAHYLKNQLLPAAEHVDAVGELLNRIRNNLFHGTKVYDDREDIAVLELVNPVLISILRECECP